MPPQEPTSANPDATSPTGDNPAGAPPPEPTPQVIGSTTPAAGQNTFRPSNQLVMPSETSPADAPSPSVVAGSNTSSPVNSTFASGTSAKGGKKKRNRLILAAIALVVILGGGYVFAFYLPNTPSNVYSAGLDHTAQAYDKLVDYSKTVQTKHYKSTKLTGDFKFVSGTIAADGNFNGKSDDKESTGALNLNVAGVKAGLNVRSVTATGQDTPDLYFQVNGIASILNGYGLSQFANLDGKWITVDHTLLESAAASAAGDSSSSSKLTAPTSAQIQDALNRVGQVNRQYLFKADADHAVLKQEKYLGKSTVNGREVYGYQVGYDKAHLETYLTAVQASINSSSLNAWIKSTTGKPASEADISSLMDSIKRADGNYTFTMYVDVRTKLVDVLHFKNPKSGTYLEIGQGYTGGGSSVYPFSFKLVSTDDPKNAGTFEITAKLDSATNKLTFAANLEAKQDGSPITFKLNADITMGNDTVNVTAPVGAVPVMQVLQSLGLGDYLGAGGLGATGTGNNAALQDFTLTQ